MEKKMKTKTKETLTEDKQLEVRPDETKFQVPGPELTDDELMSKYVGCEAFAIRCGVYQNVRYGLYNGNRYPLYSDPAVYLFSRNPAEWLRYTELCNKKFLGK